MGWSHAAVGGRCIRVFVSGEKRSRLGRVRRRQQTEKAELRTEYAVGFGTEGGVEPKSLWINAETPGL